MRRRIVSITVSLVALASIVFAGSNGMPQLPTHEPQSKERTSSASRDNNDSQPKKSEKFVDMKSDGGRQTEHRGKKILIAVGNFAAHHNGTVITCDSTVRYSDSQIECFGNVLINKGTTYIYGDRAEYDGERNEARVYSNIVKVVDKSTTLYTYNFLFNTKTNIGTFSGGGVVVDEDSQLEAEYGYYYADTKEIICVDRVQMRNETYEMKGDSVIYNTELNQAKFFTNTNIWKPEENEYLYADCGSFDRNGEHYSLTLNGYILTEEQEVWSDTLDYYGERGYARLKSNIQIDDTEQKMLIFGDWGEYWREPGDAFLTRNPSMISYDTEQSDSVFIRSDSMYLYTKDPVAERIERQRLDSINKAQEKMRADSIARADSVAKVLAVQAEEQKREEMKRASEKLISGGKKSKQETKQSAKQKEEQSAQTDVAPSDAEPNAKSNMPLNAKSAEERRTALRNKANAVNNAVKQTIDQQREGEATTIAPPTQQPSSENAEQPTQLTASTETAQADSPASASDSTRVDSVKVDSLAADSLANPADTLTKKEKKAIIKAEKRYIADSIRKIKQDSLNAKLDRIADRRQAKRTAYYRKLERIDSLMRVKAQERADKKLRRRVLRLEKRGITIKPVDASVWREIDSLIAADSIPADSLLRRMLDSLIHVIYKKDTVGVAQEPTDTIEVDSTYRLILAFRNVKMFRSDAQMVCDSLSTSTQDSVINLYIAPVLWNEDNQITSEVMHIHTSNSQITHANFEGKPMMVSEIDTAHYNQVTGKTMTSHFRNNQIYRNDVDGNVQTIYYMQENENSPDITMMAYIESGDMSSYIENSQLVGITYRVNPTYTFYPMDKIPETRSQKLDGFKWEINRRPSRDSVFNRTIRPSLREEKGTLEKPHFPIASAMERRKERLIKLKSWSDRTDTLSVETLEWVESVSSVF